MREAAKAHSASFGHFSFAAHGVLFGAVGLFGLVGFTTDWFPASNVYFGGAEYEHGSAAELAMRYAYASNTGMFHLVMAMLHLMRLIMDGSIGGGGQGTSKDALLLGPSLQHFGQLRSWIPWGEERTQWDVAVGVALMHAVLGTWFVVDIINAGDAV
ncbi:hypothetical protein HDU83_000274 [Entophlyctis luteolus]|nr:hypothetical protein HDU83_000274 [Entophlyctis luteolus]